MHQSARQMCKIPAPDPGERSTNASAAIVKIENITLLLGRKIQARAPVAKQFLLGLSWKQAYKIDRYYAEDRYHSIRDTCERKPSNFW